jgi:ATP-dependent Clp protease ATP-binding subunit ClpB
MEDELKKQVVGQDEAVSRVSHVIRRSRAGIGDPSKPIGSFLFLGPTGVGKTELTKVLTKFMFNDEKALIRIDMSEYMERHAVSKLIGSPPGYVGHDESGQLTEAVRHRPYSVVLFDEVEKAHPDIFNILLQVLDDGRLTDSQGRTVNFTNTIIIMTSNLGSSGLTGEDEKNLESRNAKIMKSVQGFFKPEFINRIDEIVFFTRLKLENMIGIVEIQLKYLIKKLTDNKIDASVELSAKEYLAKRGFDELYGARPLKRVIQSEIENILLNQDEKINKEWDALRISINKSKNDYENSKNLSIGFEQKTNEVVKNLRDDLGNISKQNERNIEMIRKDLCKLVLHFLLKQ